MNAHGAPLSSATTRHAAPATSIDTSSGYRNLFGDAPPQEQYSGFGGDTADRLKSRRMFRWLSGRFGRPFSWPEGDADNRRIPAGYTFFAQFVIHDVVQSLADLPDLQSGTVWPRNARTSRLVLDTIYGKGPLADPLLYGACPAIPRGTGGLRIAGKPDAGPRDLPRLPCPFTGKRAYSDNLIADARNDDNLIIAQMTVVFHLLHNIVYGELYKNGAPGSDARIFALARKIVVRIYRAIVVNDLLAKLLHPTIYRKYAAADAGVFLDLDDARMPLEFSHAAARFGHFMVRDLYDISDRLGDQSVKNILWETSAGSPWDMPLKPQWLIDWARLFDKEAAAPALPSRRFGPAMNATLTLDTMFTDDDDEARRPGDSGGLAYRDLLRGAESALRSVNSIVAQLPPWVTELSPLVRGRAVDPAAVVEWLNADRTGDPTTIGEYIDCIAADIPLLLFIMVEAAKTAVPPQAAGDQGIRSGECLGAIGSVILAEFFFREYRRTYALIEDDDEAKAAAVQIFGDNLPDSMPKLLGEISRRKNWDDVNPKFW